jgi:fumarate reductase subunit C
MATSKKVSVGTNPLPISFKEFAKNPVVGTLFLVLIAISYLYIDVRSTFKDQITSQAVKVQSLDNKVDIMQVALRKCDSSLAVATTKLSTLEQLGKIEHLK